MILLEKHGFPKGCVSRVGGDSLTDLLFVSNKMPEIKQFMKRLRAATTRYFGPKSLVCVGSFANSDGKRDLVMNVLVEGDKDEMGNTYDQFKENWLDWYVPEWFVTNVVTPCVGLEVVRQQEPN